MGNSTVVEALEKITAVHNFLAGVLPMATRSVAFQHSRYRLMAPINMNILC